MGFTETIRNITSYLETSGTKRLPSIFDSISLGKKLTATDHVESIKEKASRYDGVHPDPGQDDLLGILRSLRSSSHDASFFRAEKDANGEPVAHYLDRPIDISSLSGDPEVRSIFLEKT